MRMFLWLGIALPYGAAVVLLASPRGDLQQKVADARFLIEQFTALATAITAAIAAFSLIIPGQSRKLLLLLPIPLAVWAGTLGQGCLQDWWEFGPDGLRLHDDWMCLPAIIAVGAGPALAMVVMLRRGAPLTPRVTMALGGLAAAALGDFGLRFFHPQDASLMVLVWQFGAVVLLSALAGTVRHRILHWRHTIPIVSR
jgi:hypothetical protein